ncbi:integrase catalytic domain-containing protein [Trichonephila clavipes]|nr:integrase catalytic domain-containing protein [Trichonephila clavipes]
MYVETPLHPEKLTVWCALWAGGIIGPYFFKNDEGHNDTVNGDRYRAMITNFFIPELNNHDIRELWFQQDGATYHTARATIDLLKDTFGDRLISRFGPVNWPPRSCDLTPLDYFLLVYVKSLVYADKPQTLDHLEDNIRHVIADIRPQMFEKVIENWTSRLDYIRASRGSHMPEIIFKMGKGIETNSNPTRFEGQPEVAVLTYGNKCVLLNTFMIFVKSADGYRIKLRGLLGNASTIARKSRFKFRSANQSITGINGTTQSSKDSENMEVSHRDSTFARNVQFSLLPKITDAIPVSKLNISDLNIPASIELADFNFHMPGQIDILIGSELFFEILNPEQHYLQEGNVILQNTKFGYLVTGTFPQSQKRANCCLISEPSLDVTVKKFFELESLPDDSKEITKSEEEIYCEEHFVRTYKRDKTGRFIFRLPIKENAETLLGYPKENAVKRQNGIWEKLNKNNTMETLYKELMSKYEPLGQMEEIKKEELDKINYYILHHSVYKPEKASTLLWLTPSNTQHSLRTQFLVHWCLFFTHNSF